MTKLVNQSLHFLTTWVFLIFLFLFNHINAQLTEIPETRDPATFPVTTGTPHFTVDLDYPQAFELKIMAYNGNETQTGFCEAIPSQILTKVEWNGRINTTNDDEDEDENHSYDNIEFFDGYYFILESRTFSLIAIKDFNDPSSYITIESEFKNFNDEQQLEDTYLILDPDESYLYIITRKKLIYYSIKEFKAALEQGKEIPKVSVDAPNWKTYDMILSIRYYMRRLYIVADNYVEVYVLSYNDQITPQLKFDNEFFQTESVSIVDIAFRGNYLFVLDQLKGIYVVDVTNQDLPQHNNLTDKYKFIGDDTRGTQKGQFIEVVGDSVHVVSSGSKNPYIFEYMVVGNQNLEFNRKTELYQSVRDTFTDSNFFYLVTGFFNMVTKHSVPGRYFRPSVEDYLTEYWPLFGAKALVSRTFNKTSRVAALHEDFVTVLRFEEANPYISCDTAGVQEGLYSYKLEAILRDCPAKKKNAQSDWNTVCQIDQEIKLQVIDDSVDVVVGNVQEASRPAIFLWIGIGLMILLIIVVIYLVRKYKTQYNRLEEKIKFKKLGNESTEQNMGGDTPGGKNPVVDSQKELVDPFSINIQAELQKAEEQERKKAQMKSPGKGINTGDHHNAEIGDTRPLDIEAIYGAGGKAKEDSF